jgi:DmsE family decaheme c-type cytochrome
MNIRSLKLHLMVAATILLQLGMTGAIAEDKGIIDWEALNPDIKGATFVKSSEKCLECHEEYMRTYAITKMGMTLPDGGCESCHGPMSKHLDAPRQKPALVVSQKTIAPEQSNAICSQCHQSGLQMNWKLSPHAAAGNTCTDCHNIMSMDDPVRNKLTQVDTCFRCHQDKRAQMFRFSRHPVREGKVVCSNCHNPHGSPGPSNLAKNTVNEVCYQCHQDKRGPFLWEHQPVQEDCTICHDPHGTTQPRMLKVRLPMLCQQCHQLGSGHPSDLRDGRLVGDNVSSNYFLVGKSCENCHSSLHIHGSNHPSGVRFQR